jgi:asparagine synthase (glutamine-hydrolysing)
MCGISGIIVYHPASGAVDADELARITNAQARRGPDAEGFWFSGDHRVGFGHRRLAVIDLTATANQPLLSHDRRYITVFNGEIYNYRELRAKLAAFGARFRTNSDTEVIIESYRHWGDTMLSKLRGMFAFALFDCLDNRLLLARDAYGIKPLYYSNDGYSLRFASSLKALRQGNLASNDPDPAGVAGFLLMGSVPEPYTIYQAARLLPAGHFLEIAEGVCGKPRLYTSVATIWRQGEMGNKGINADEANERITVAVRDTVAHHLVADVPVGAFLSAGVDSGALVGLASNLTNVPITTITLGFADFKGTASDETVLAEEMARRYGTWHQTVWIGDATIRADIPKILAAMDQPSIDGLNTWLVSQAASQCNLKVVLSGVGGDELLGGYGHFHTLPRWRHWLAAMDKIPLFSRTAANFARMMANLHLLPPKMPALFRFGTSLAALYFAQRGLFMPWEIEAIIGKDMARTGLAALTPPDFLAGNFAEINTPVPGKGPTSDFAQIAALDSCNYLRNQLLRDSDWASMDHSLELRTPLVDTVLLEQLAPVLPHCPQGWRRKRGLAAAPLPPLPETVVSRAKSGFSLPMFRWMLEVDALDGWRKFPALCHPHCHWSRRLAGTLIANNILEVARS